MDSHEIDPSSPTDTTPPGSAASPQALLAELEGLHHLAVRAEDLARLVGMHGSERALDRHQLSALEQARSNASAIVASLDRAR